MAETTTNAAPAVPKPVTVAEYLANQTIPPEIRMVLNQGIQAFETEKKSLIEIVVNNKQNRFSKEWLEAITDIDQLRGLAALAAGPAPAGPSPLNPGNGMTVNYMGQAGAPPILGNQQPPAGRKKQEALTPLVMNFANDPDRQPYQRNRGKAPVAAPAQPAPAAAAK